MARDLTDQVLWWNPETQRWQQVDWVGFVRARGLATWLPKDAAGPDNLSEIPAGDHRFIVCVLEDDLKTLVNFRAHRYVFGDKGVVVDWPTTLNEEERKLWDEYYAQTEENAELKAKWSVLAEREFQQILKLPLELLEAIPRDSPWPPKMDMDYGFWAAYQDHGGSVIRETGSKRAH